MWAAKTTHSIFLLLNMKRREFNSHTFVFSNCFREKWLNFFAAKVALIKSKGTACKEVDLSQCDCYCSALHSPPDF